ncbi:MAG: hypothetical protein LBD70_00915 [Bifidobacteriaceae bacterium]|jgi:hypothetical protein|nr:hypothetical protein [Bifidobacteriaceae bacterium]
MPGVDLVEPLPPAPFSGWWLAGACVALALAAALVLGPWLARWLARWRARRTARREAGRLAEASRPGDRDAEARARIDRIERRWRDGELADRAAAEEIATLVREFWGREAPVLTLLELRVKGHSPKLTAVIEAAYPVEFGVKGQGDIADLAERARRAVVGL